MSFTLGLLNPLSQSQRYKESLGEFLRKYCDNLKITMMSRKSQKRVKKISVNMINSTVHIRGM